MSDSIRLAEGARLGRYQIVRRLGAGAMGEVYLADDPQIGRRLALKTVRVEEGRVQEVEERHGRGTQPCGCRYRIGERQIDHHDPGDLALGEHRGDPSPAIVIVRQEVGDLRREREVRQCGGEAERGCHQHDQGGRASTPHH